MPSPTPHALQQQQNAIFVVLCAPAAIGPNMFSGTAKEATRSMDTGESSWISARTTSAQADGTGPIRCED